MTLRENKIDMTNVKPEDLVISNITGSCLSIQVDGAGTIGITGRQYESEETYNLGVVNMSTLGKQPMITSPGIYLAVLEGIDEVILDISGEGDLCWKETGD